MEHLENRWDKRGKSVLSLPRGVRGGGKVRPCVKEGGKKTRLRPDLFLQIKRGHQFNGGVFGSQKRAR